MGGVSRWGQGNSTLAVLACEASFPVHSCCCCPAPGWLRRWLSSSGSLPVNSAGSLVPLLGLHLSPSHSSPVLAVSSSGSLWVSFTGSVLGLHLSPSHSRPAQSPLHSASPVSLSTWTMLSSSLLSAWLGLVSKLSTY